MMLFDLLMIGGGVMCLFRDKTMLLILGRLVQGLAIGAYYTVGPVYLQEITPVEIFEKVGGGMSIAHASGVIIALSMGKQSSSKLTFHLFCKKKKLHNSMQNSVMQ